MFWIWFAFSLLVGVFCLSFRFVLLLICFSANYIFSKSTRATLQDSDNEDVDGNEVINGAPLSLFDGSGFVRERIKPKIIRFRSLYMNKYLRELTI